jgi:hypothetical protein
MTMRINLFAPTCALALASCSGGGGSAPVPQPSPRATTAAAKLAIVIPLSASGMARVGSARRPRFVSGGTLTASMVVNTAAPRGIDLSSSAPGCTQTNSARTCTVAVDLPLGPDTITVATYDGPLSGGQPTGALLAQAQIHQTIVEGSDNAIVMSLLGVPKNVVLQLDRVSVPVGTATTLQLTANVTDPDGYQITSDPYLTPVTVTSDDASGQITLDKTTLTSPSDAITVHYAGKLLPKPVTFSVTSPVQAYPPGSSTMLVANPWTTFGPIAYPIVEDVAAGPDGNVWFTECKTITSTCKLGKITPAGTITEFADVPFAKGLVAGPDGNVWFTEDTQKFIGRITPTGTITQFPIPGFNNGGSGPITVGPDNNIWFAEGDRIGVLTVATGAITDYPIGGLYRPSSIVTGTDGALWFSEQQQIGRITTAGAVTQYPVDGSGVYNVGPPIVFGPSTTMYFPVSGQLWSMTTAGVLNRSSLMPAGVSITPAHGLGPDGNIWGPGAKYDPYGYAQGGGVVRVSFSGATTLYLAEAPQPFGSTYGVNHPAFGPDGNLWFSDGQGLARFRLAY